MNDIVLKDKYGVKNTYSDISAICIADGKGGFAKYLPASTFFGPRRFKESVTVLQSLGEDAIDSELEAYLNEYYFDIEPFTIGNAVFTKLSCAFSWDFEPENIMVGGYATGIGNEGNGSWSHLSLSTLNEEVGTFTVIATKNTTVDEWLLANTEAASGSGGDTPAFDLATMGLGTVGATPTFLGTDTTKIMEALEKGAVRFTINTTVAGNVVPISVIPNPFYAMDAWMCTAVVKLESKVLLNIVIQEGVVSSWFSSLNEGEAVATSIDLSGYESNGQIAETYADGTTKTTTVEFDASGNPTKITDGDGNVTTLTW